MSLPERIQAVLPGASVRETPRGFEVGGFSCPPVVAQRMLRDAGLNAVNYWGATLVTAPPEGSC